MKFSKLAFVVAFVLSAILFAEVYAHADEANQSTRLTFGKSVAIPSQVLPAGTYLFKVADSNDVNLVQIYNTDGTRLYATIQTISTKRPEPTVDTVVTLAQQPNGRPDALLKWFYPGDTTGHEFVYPEQEQQQLAQYRQQTMPFKETADPGD